VRTAGFRDVLDYQVDVLNADYLTGRPDGLRLRTLEQLLAAVR
jgi:hypothetical protein